MGTRSLVNDAATYMPNAEDRRQLMDIKDALSHITQEAKRTSEATFNDMANQTDFPVATLKVPGSPARPLTPELANVLMQVADQLSRGRAVFVAPYDTMLTTQDAADFLGVSRPTLVKLLEGGAIPFEKVGRHRRVLLADLQEYMNARHQNNISTFDELAADEDPRATLDNPLIS
ncbi:MerR family transcriptional regulator [Bifidobacterium goeldii]|uniref:MerR family transcriptional regulator n=1 Tax=Bifidobacterium goeldii TaxID=2306975 RepID=A0A430FMT0_9BIFI|nr:helix-turn-helix domain-containing protein [Bifidobacterium goeldii]RSX54131.1 MerR family transcriptional regulator [Bifidobacterium goeldii]